jgi:transcriptional regulator with XRE-family HTH domain
MSNRRYTAGSLTGSDLRHIRQGLLLTQQDLADVLGYAQKIRISEYERDTNPVPIPHHIQQAVVAMWESGRVPRRGKAVREWARAESG